ncbi:MAG: hypothetical protein FWH10_01230 [Oscillospiraceae bacterium]|nr:hypothetical protein [Oscillospiraceae bacterium]
MDAKNTKTIVIVLLLLANMFFVYNIISLKISSENIPSEMIDDAANILAKNGFIADKSKIPARKPAAVLYEGIYSEAALADIVKDFSGITDEEFGEAVDIYVPAGISYTAGDYRFIFSETDYFNISISESLYIGSEETEAKEEEIRESLSAVAGNGQDKINDGAARKTEKIIRDFIRKRDNQDVRLNFDVIKTERSGDLEYVWINQTADGVRVDSHIVYVEIRDGAVKYFSGRWYFGELTIVARRPPLLDSVNILFKSAEADGNIIQGGDRLAEMETEYHVMRHGAGGEFYIVPSWRLVFESGRTFSYNMITGSRY